MSKLLRQNAGGTDYTMAGCALSATCTTAAATAAKVATLTDGDVLADGMSVAIQFTNGNTAASPLTLTVGGVTANICDSRGQNIGGNIWQAGNVVTFLYTFGKFLLLNCVVDEVTLNNMNSVSSNAVFNAFGKISAQQEATIVPSRFAPDYAAYCRWWRCGRIVTVNVYTGGVYCKIAAAEIIFTGLPKPIDSSFPRAILNWGGQNSVADAIYYVDNQGNLLIMGGSSYTDTVIYGEGSFMYITSDA